MRFAHPADVHFGIANVPSCQLTRQSDYGCGAWVGRGSVVGFGVGTAGEVVGVRAGVTVCTDGPVFVVSFARVLTVRGISIQISNTATETAKTTVIQLLAAVWR
jgi:hypothetical protein